MRRKLFALCVALWLLLGTVPAVAQGFDPAQTGTISVTLTDPLSDQPMAGADFALYYVATVTAGEGLHYVYTDAFADCGIDLTDPALAVKLDTFATEQGIPAQTATTDATGRVSFTALPLGLYVVKQAGEVAGFAPCAPFVVTVPSKEGEEFVYDVNATPKTDVQKLTTITIQKVWNTDDSTDVADSVTVQLLRGDTVVKTALLNAQNNWQVSYPDMPQSDEYRVKEQDVPKGFTATYSRKGDVFVVTNTASLAQTGQLIWPIPVLSAAGILLIVVGFVVLKKRKTHG